MFNHLFKKGAAVILTAALLVFTSSAFAKDLKIGVVDINLLLEKYIEEKDIYSLLNEEFFARDQYLLKKRDQIESLRRELMGSSGDAPAEIREIERNIVNLEREFVRISNDTRQEFNLRKNEELYKLQREINTAILRYAKDYDYDLILESGLLFAKEALYLTDPIFQTLVQDDKE